MKKQLFLICFLVFGLAFAQRGKSSCEQLKEWIEYNQSIPYCQVSHHGIVYPPKSSSVQLKPHHLGDSFAVRLLVPPAIRKSYGNIARYAVYGMNLRSSDGHDFKLIYRDSLFRKRFSGELVYAFKNLHTQNDLPGTAYLLSFDSLVQLDCKGVRYRLDGTWGSWSFFELKTRPEQAPELKYLGKPSMLLLVNGKEIEAKQWLRQKDTLRLYLDFQAILPVGVEQEHFSVSYQIREHGCLGGKRHYSAEDEQLPIEVSFNHFQVGFGGEFYILVNRVVYTGMDGKQYLISLPYLNRAVKFFYNPRYE
jgi:hypothetical protein